MKLQDIKRFVIMILLGCLCLPAFSQVANEAPALIGSWTGKLKAGTMSLTLVFNFKQADGYVVCTFDSPDQNAKGIGVYKDYLSEDSVALTITQIGASYRGRIDGNKIIGKFSQGGMNFPLTMEKGSYEVIRPQTPAKPYPYKTEEIVFRNSADDVSLAGTLTYPVGYEGMKSVTVALMVTGSGLQNRDEEIFNHKPFLVIADYLARHGIATLRYDDRSFGASTGGNKAVNETTTLDYKRDAEAGIQHLRGLKKFGPVGVIGHSEGGNIAFMLGSDKAVDFVVSMAGVGVRADTALTAQYNRIMQLQGQSAQISVEQYKQIVSSTGNAWMNWFVDYDPESDIRATICPVFAINGDKDSQVISSLNLAGIEKSLPKNKKSVIKEYPSLNHLFQNCQTGVPEEYYGIEETISPAVLDDIAKWIKGVK